MFSLVKFEVMIAHIQQLREEEEEQKRQYEEYLKVVPFIHFLTLRLVVMICCVCVCVCVCIQGVAEAAERQKSAILIFFVTKRRILPRLLYFCVKITSKDFITLFRLMSIFP